MEMGFHNSLCIPFFQEGQPRSLLGAEEDVHIGKNLLDTCFCLRAAPEIAAEVDIERNDGALFLKALHHLDSGGAKLGA